MVRSTVSSGPQATWPRDPPRWGLQWPIHWSFRRWNHSVHLTDPKSSIQQSSPKRPTLLLPCDRPQDVLAVPCWCWRRSKHLLGRIQRFIRENDVFWRKIETHFRRNLVPPFYAGRIPIYCWHYWTVFTKKSPCESKWEQQNQMNTAGSTLAAYPWVIRDQVNH